MEDSHRYFMLYKPYNMVSQFVSPDNVSLLGEIEFEFPMGIHAVGRLDNHSEGLLILTTNKKVTRLLFNPITPHKRTYFVQVKNIVSQETLLQLRQGVQIQIKGGGYYTAVPWEVELFEKPSFCLDSSVEIDRRTPYSWLRITLTEGKFHQIRKMVGAVHHRCIRLIRWSIEDMELGNLHPGEVCELDEETFFNLLKITYPSNNNIY